LAAGEHRLSNLNKSYIEEAKERYSYQQIINIFNGKSMYLKEKQKE
jgi:hypothetical protein